MRIGPLTLRLRGKRDDDPYWDAFVNAAPADANNLVATGIRGLPGGTVFAVKSDVHSPEVMSQHVKDLALFLGADRCGIARLDGVDYPFAVVCVMRSEHDPREAKGIGGQASVLRGAYVTFNVAAWIRECGYRATRAVDPDADKLAVATGLGELDASGRLSVAGFSRYPYIADIVLTDLPLAPDGEGLAPIQAHVGP